MTAPAKPVRLDKWLWAARFFKTRAQAADAAGGGKVQLNGERAKPAKLLKVGDRLVVRTGHDEWTVTVEVLSDRRGPASEAQKLYKEAEQSRLAREETAARLKAERQSAASFAKGRPTKRNRRRIIQFTRNED